MKADRGLFWAAVITTIVGWGPAIAAWGASAIAAAHGCAVDEGDPHPCIVAGHDIGQLLYDMFVMGWLMLLTFPLMAVSIVLWIVVIVRRLRRPAGPPAGGAPR